MSKVLGNRLVAAATRHKVTVAVVPGVLLLVLTLTYPVQEVQLYGLLASLPVVVLFIVAYVPERPDRFWFGTSLLVRSFAVLAIVVAAALVRLFGPSSLQVHLVTVFIGLTFSSMLMGTWYLIDDQARHHRGLGGWLRCTVAHQCDDEGQHQ